jgi:hypothetical protein
LLVRPGEEGRCELVGLWLGAKLVWTAAGGAEP